MKKVWFLIFSFIFFTLLLSSPILSIADDPNEVAYQNRFSLKSGTILNSEGEGDCLIFPYYDVRTIGGKHQITEFQIQNVGEYGIAAKLRVREWSRGSEVFSKDIWIPSNGVWTGTIEIIDDGTNAVLTSSDNAILRYGSSFFYLSNPLSDGSLFSTKYIRKNNGESTLYGYIEVIGEEKTSPGSVDGRVGRLAKSERDCPNTLKGKTVIRRVEDGVSMGYDAAAIGNFSRGQGSLFRSVGNTFPRLDRGEDALDQLEFQLSKCEIRGSYSLDPSTQSRTSMIVTFPTKLFHYRNGNRINQVDNPFETPKEMGGEIVGVTLSEEGEKIADSEIDLPFSVNVIGLYKEDSGSLTGIDNVSLPTGSSELGEAMLTSDSLSQRVLIPDFENYFEPNQGKFTMYKGLPAVGLILQESQNSGILNVTITPVGYSRCFTPSNAEVILTPAVPSGPTLGFVGTSYTFTASGASSSLGHDIQYFFDWGDGTNSDWLPVGTFSASTDPTKTWTTGGVYTVKVRARCATHTNIVSNWSNGLTVSIPVETVSAPTTPTGPTFGVVNNYSASEYPFDKSYSYTTGGSTSSLGHPIQYFFDWGDGTNSGWLPVSPTMTISASQTWTKGGVFTIKAMARSATNTNFVSNPSNGLVVTVESVSPPNMLSGPATGLPNTQYTYSTGGAFSNLGHQVQYFFDWGDNTNSGWLPIGTTTATKTWSAGNSTNKGVYSVKARARCATDLLAVSVWTSQLQVLIEWISPPTTPVSVGPNDPNAGQPGQTFTFSTGGAFSSVGDTVEYQFDWKGDGISDLSPWGSDTQSKTFTAGGTYSVRARARCVTHTSIVSDWSSALTVKIEQITVSTPSGPTSPTLNTPCTYTASGSSNIGDPVQIRFAFSDGSDSGWLPVGTTNCQKSWTSGGSFTVMAKARCATHISNESAWSAPLQVTVNNPAPTLTNISPTSGSRLQTLNVVFTGNNFTGGSSVSFSASGISVNSFSVDSATQITANITIAGTAVLGQGNASVTNPGPGGGTVSLPFTVNNPAPTVTGITPNTGATGSTVSITNLSGTGFISGVTTVKLTKSGSTDISGSSVTVVSPTKITCTFDLTGAIAGSWDVVVTNATPGGGTVTLTGGFTVF